MPARRSAQAVADPRVWMAERGILLGLEALLRGRAAMAWSSGRRYAAARAAQGAHFLAELEGELVFSVIVTIPGPGRDAGGDIARESGTDGSRLVFTFEGDRIDIGRASDNDLVLPDSDVSRRHARIVIVEPSFIAIDLESSNGIRVNDRIFRSPVVVLPSDEIRIGRYSLQVRRQVFPDAVVGDSGLELGSDTMPIEWGGEHPTFVGPSPAGPSPDGPVPRPFQGSRVLPRHDDITTDARWPIPAVDNGPFALQPLSDDERTLLALVGGEPRDDAPRAVYADWLQERGQPAGEIIATMCRPEPDNAERQRHDDTLYDLLYRHGDRWLAPLCGDSKPRFQTRPRGGADVSTVPLPGRYASDRSRPVSSESPLCFHFERGFLAHPLCVLAAASPVQLDPLFRLSPALYLVEPEHWWQGSFAVHRARAVTADETGGVVAIKRLYEAPWPSGMPHGAALTERVKGRARLLHEAGILSIIDHPNVVRSLGLGYWGTAGDMALVLEWHDAHNLSDVLSEAGGSFKPWVAAAVAAQVCRGLDALDGAIGVDGLPAEIVVNRLEPRCVWLGNAGRVVLADLCTASVRPGAVALDEGRSDREGASLPEDAGRRRSGDERAGSAAAIASARQHAIRGVATMLETMVRSRRAPGVYSGASATIPAGLQVIIDRASSSAGDERYATARDMGEDLDRVIVGQGWPLGREALAAELAPLMQELTIRHEPSYPETMAVEDRDDYLEREL